MTSYLLVVRPGPVSPEYCLRGGFAGGQNTLRNRGKLRDIWEVIQRVGFCASKFAIQAYYTV